MGEGAGEDVSVDEGEGEGARGLVHVLEHDQSGPIGPDRGHDVQQNSGRDSAGSLCCALRQSRLSKELGSGGAEAAQPLRRPRGAGSLLDASVSEK